MKSSIAIALLTIPLFASAHEHAAHVHGVAELDVAIDGRQVLITLESPADNLLGFEHAPKSEAEKAKFAAVKTLLNSPAELFVPDAAAQCKAAPAQVTLPTFNKGAHSDIEAEYRFDCASAPANIALPLWKNAAGLKKLTVNLATAQGQKQLSLKKGDSIKLK
ncbi:ZrgA family zinc uptake protein [Chitinibacter tainanensis]|uniref:ZrgA family zinc uptake protein n=1 Tax=Chitinibacter tainanensis TaxID=230667 RepID=UPI0004087C91|nr:DUF2796 domain-containing protein [Chitinibacter tainanensis]